MKRDRRVVSLLALAAALALTACSAAGSGRTPSTTPEAPADPTATLAAPSAAPTTPSLAVAAGLFTGSAQCWGVGAGEDADPTLSYKACSQTASDPRLSGRATGSGLWTDVAEHLSSLYGSSTLVNEGGSWECSDLVITAADNPTGGEYQIGIWDSVCTGTGDYAGLIAYTHAASSHTTIWGFIGWIEQTP